MNIYQFQYKLSGMLPRMYFEPAEEISRCPNGDCSNSSGNRGNQSWYFRYGAYQTKIRGRAQRYRCKHCGTTFSAVTFSAYAFTKKQVDYFRVLEVMATATGQRAASRALGIRESTLLNRVRRLRKMGFKVRFGEDEPSAGLEDVVAM